MKKYTRLIAVFLILLLSLSLLAGCKKDQADYAIRVGDRTVSENDYYRNVALLRSNYLAADEDAEDTVDYWTEPMDDDSTVSEVFVDYINEYLITAKLYAVQFDQLGLSFSEKEESTIQNALSDTIESIGGMSEFNSYLSQLNYTYEEYLEEIYDSAKKSKVLAYYFGEDGEDPVSLQDIKDYYNVHNARIKVVYVLKVDGDTGEALSDEDLAAAKQKAQDALTAATTPSDTDTFGDVIEIYSDAQLSQDDGIVISDDGSYTDEITDAVMELEVGEVTMLDLDSAYMIIKRYDGTSDEVFTATLQQSTLETIRADEIEDMLEQWESAADIKINKKITKKYAPEKLIEE